MPSSNDHNKFSALCQTLLKHNPIEHKDIPDIQLYMDQVLDFFENKLSGFKRTKAESVFTKTMINNYVKAGVIDPPSKKKYSKRALMDLVMVYTFKQVLSIQDTQTLLKVLHAHPESSYERFRNYESQILSQLLLTHPNLESAKIKASLDSTELQTPPPPTQEELLNWIVELSIEASIKKRLAEQMLDQLSSVHSDTPSI